MERYLVCKFGQNLCRVTFIGSHGFVAKSRNGQTFSYGTLIKGIDRGEIRANGMPMTDRQFLEVIHHRFPGVAFDVAR